MKNFLSYGSNLIFLRWAVYKWEAVKDCQHKKFFCRFWKTVGIRQEIMYTALFFIKTNPKSLNCLKLSFIWLQSHICTPNRLEMRSCRSEMVMAQLSINQCFFWLNISILYWTGLKIVEMWILALGFWNRRYTIWD